jgi:ABC-type siderophore export system fused ATPase/permease subunit
MGWQTIFVIYHCRNVPPLTRGMAIASRLWFSSFGLLCIAVTIMFLLWNLTYLAFASGLALVLVLVLFYVFAWKPYIKFRKVQSPWCKSKTDFLSFLPIFRRDLLKRAPP